MNHKNTRNKVQTTLNCQGKLIDLSTPCVMGILNITPDSFYAESRTTSVQEALVQAEKMLVEGAKMLDIGGMSSRPGAELLSSKQECERILPVIKALREEFPDVILSVDTISAETSRQSILSGANMINDISAGSLDAEMIPTVGKLNCPYILMHMRGTPETMKSLTTYDDLLADISHYFIQKITTCQQAGIQDLVLDLGFGFAKTVEQNFKLLQQMSSFEFLGYPLLAGISRKSMIWKTLETQPEQALNGTTALHMICLQQGAKILRVHDVKEAVECIQLFEKLTTD